MGDDDLVFKALADPTRRLLLDLLFARDGRTLGELEAEVAMTRFGVMKHLRVLEDAGLVVTRRVGREKFHHLNPVPIREVHDRWIDKYTEHRITALLDLKHELEGVMTTTTRTETTQVYRVYIRATAQAIWDAITQPAWSARYGYGGFVDYDLQPGGAYRVRPSAEFRAASDAQGGQLPDVVIEGEVLESDPPHRLVTTFRMLMDPTAAAEPASRITHEIKEMPDGTCSLTLTHELPGSPHLAMILGGTYEDQGAGGGHAWVLSDLKTLLETGRGFHEPA